MKFIHKSVVFFESITIMKYMDIERAEQLATIAKLYYEDELNQAQVSTKMGYSRSMISRLLSEARQNRIVEIKVNFLKPVFEHTGEVMAEGNVVSCGRQVATAEGKIVDAKGEIYATGTATCLVFEIPTAHPKP